MSNQGSSFQRRDELGLVERVSFAGERQQRSGLPSPRGRWSGQDKVNAGLCKNQRDIYTSISCCEAEISATTKEARDLGNSPRRSLNGRDDTWLRRCKRIDWAN